MRRTKIVCTIGPATRDPKTLERLVAAGMNVARLNFSHGTHEEHAQVVQDVRAIAERLRKPVAILLDLAGPKVRTGPIAAGSIALVAERRITLTSRDVPGDENEVSLTYRDLPRDVQAGDTLLLSDGALELSVESVAGDDIRCRVVVGGELSSHKGINVPTRSLGVAVPTAKDCEDLRFAVAHDVEYIAISFVRAVEEVQKVRRFVQDADRDIPLIAKIEQREAIDCIDEILQVVDGIMIARGDLGVEIAREDVPRVQKSIITKANNAGKPAITATQMLKSMVEASTPTRAEVSDVANAVLDGSDAVMLSEETAVGRYAVESVEMMARIATSAEQMFPHTTWRAKFESGRQFTPEQAVALSACRMADRLHAKAIMTLTQSGSTTREVAKYRPGRPILALTPNPETYCRLALVWGVQPYLVEAQDDPDLMERQALQLARQSGHVAPDDTVVLTAGLPLHVAGTTNLIRIAVVPEE